MGDEGEREVDGPAQGLEALLGPWLGLRLGLRLGLGLGLGLGLQ